MKIKYIKLGNSIKVGNQEVTFAPRGKDYDIELQSPLIKVTHIPSGAVSYTSLYNTIYFVSDEENQSEGLTTGSVGDHPKGNRGARAAK